MAPDLNHGFREIFDHKGFLAAHAEDRSLRSFLGKVRWTLYMCVRGLGLFSFVVY